MLIKYNQSLFAKRLVPYAEHRNHARMELFVEIHALLHSTSAFLVMQVILDCIVILNKVRNLLSEPIHAHRKWNIAS